MAELEHGKPVSLEELMVSTLAMTDAAKAADREGRYSDVQVQRIASHGHVRSIKAREVLVEPGQHVVPFFVVRAGQIEIVRPPVPARRSSSIYGPRQFTYRNWIKSNMRTGEGFTTEFAVTELGN